MFGETLKTGVKLGEVSTERLSLVSSRNRKKANVAVSEWQSREVAYNLKDKRVSHGTLCGSSKETR